VIRVIEEKKESDFRLKVVRDRKEQTVSLRLDNASQ